ncbi:MAG: DUF3221 domain-containing protein [Clostridia bacterium]
MKKVLKVIGIILGVLIILGLIFFIVDYNRVKNNERPIFCIHNPAGAMNDGGTVEFFGLGYKVIDFRTLAGFDDIKIGTWFMDYNDFNEEMKVYEKKIEEELQKNDYNIGNNVFNARIKEIREYNGITTILIEGLESNDINHRGEFDFSVDNDTELLWKEAKIELSSLKEGQNVSITSTGEILESYPAQLTKVTKIIVLEDEL